MLYRGLGPINIKMLQFNNKMAESYYRFTYIRGLYFCWGGGELSRQGLLGKTSKFASLIFHTRWFPTHRKIPYRKDTSPRPCALSTRSCLTWGGLTTGWGRTGRRSNGSPTPSTCRIYGNACAGSTQVGLYTTPQQVFT